VKTRPAGAAVFWGDIALGASPIKHAAIPCGTATVTLRREHYVEVTRTIRAKRGRNVVVAQRLRREPGKVVAAATPRPRAATLPATAATGPLAAR
jgi:hypothetical protein